MRPFKYVRPQTIEEALKALSQPGLNAMAIAGGTDLVVNMRSGLVSPDEVVDVSQVAELKGICLDQTGFLRIGAATTLNEITRSQLVREKAPIMVQAAKMVGSVQTRSLATIGGNLASAVPSADMAPPLIALGAKIVVAGLERQRTIAVEELFAGPKRTSLKKGEIIQHISVPIQQGDTGWSFIKLGRRKAVSLSIVSVAVVLSSDRPRSKVLSAKIALGSVAPTPMRAIRAETALIARTPINEAADDAAEEAAGECKPIDDFRASAEYRREMVRVLVKRAILDAVRVCSGGGE